MKFDIVIVSATPGGIMSAIAAARMEKTVALIDRTAHIGGLPANGLGATDIATRGGTGGLFKAYVDRIRQFYVDKYGPDSQQVKDCSDGYHFEPKVAEKVLSDWLDEYKSYISVFTRHQFDALPQHVHHAQDKHDVIESIQVTDLNNGELKTFAGGIFIDASYEGDLAAAAGFEFRVGREGKSEFDEPFAGRLYVPWMGEIQEDSTGMADNAVQAYNYRLCLTNVAENRIPIEKPTVYRREEYLSLIDDVKNSFWSGTPTKEVFLDGIGRLVNIVKLPNGKTDANNQHLAMISTDLPEENWPWPMAGWEWRDAYAERLKNYILGLIWFAQNDDELPAEFRDNCREWGLAKDEYEDNGGFPRQVYVREGRRISGEYLFTAHDAIITAEGKRPPLHSSSITSSHYALDSHAVLKREPARDCLEGFFSSGSKRIAPYTVPYGVIVPRGATNLLTPVPVSGTHIGFSTLRMEPCWMALGEAAGIASAQALDSKLSVREISIDAVQLKLLENGAVLLYFKGFDKLDPEMAAALQYFGLKGFFPECNWEIDLDAAPTDAETALWKQKCEDFGFAVEISSTQSRGERLLAIYRQITA